MSRKLWPKSSPRTPLQVLLVRECGLRDGFQRPLRPDACLSKRSSLVVGPLRPPHAGGRAGLRGLTASWMPPFMPCRRADCDVRRVADEAQRPSLNVFATRWCTL